MDTIEYHIDKGIGFVKAAIFSVNRTIVQVLAI
jgi:hypothetical protein